MGGTGSEAVQAAGGVVVDDKGRMLVVHRPRYNDWTFPKGKLDPGETLEECAIREVREETGYQCSLLEPLATIEYVDHRGRQKFVHYWWMEPVSGHFEPNEEVDVIEWLEPAGTAHRLSYQRDLDVLREALSS